MPAELIATEESMPANELAMRAAINRRPWILLATIVALLACSLELELLEQLDSLSAYMRISEIFWDVSVALLLLLAMATAWWFVLLLVAKSADHLPVVSPYATPVFWCLGLAVPLGYFGIEVIKAVRLLSRHSLHMGVLGSFVIGPILFILVLLALYKVGLLRLQQLCAARLAPIGWFHIIVVAVAMCGLWLRGIRVFHDFVHPAQTMVSSTLPDIYLITIDALRAQDISVYGYQRNTTPNLERFANRASTFEYFFANSNFTTAATTSIETGRLPWSHHVFHLGGFLRGSAKQKNLASLLRDRGYYTAMISSNDMAGPVQHRTMDSYDAVERLLPACGLTSYYRYTDLPGLNTMYTLYGTLLRTSATLRSDLEAWMCNMTPPLPAEPVFDRARHLLEQTGNGQPHFLWTHIFPPHDPYLAPLPFRGTYLPGSGLTHVYNYIGFDNLFLPRNVTGDELHARYDEDILYADKAVGRFLDWLDQTGRLDNSIVIISADHGESFEHQWFKHTGPYLYNGLIRVPLLVHLPGQTQPSKIHDVANQVDLLPTILELVGVAVPDWSEGSSLVPALKGQSMPERSIFSMNLEKDSIFKPISQGTIAVIDNDFKYVKRLDTHEASLFHYRTDPFDQNNLLHSDPVVAARMQTIIDEKLRQVNRVAQPAQGAVKSHAAQF